MNDNAKVIDSILKITRDIQLYVNKSMDYFSDKFLHVKSHRFNLKQELIAKSGFWTAKKRYALWAVNIEGRDVEELEVKGLDVVRTSFPKLFRNFMTQMLTDILKEVTKEQIDKSVLRLKEDVETVNFIDVARPTGVKEVSKFCDNTHQPFNFSVKGTPVHIKAAVNYNDYLRYFNLDDKFPYIGDGEKIKWLYLKTTNPYKFDTLAFRDNDEDPKEILEYIEKYVDRERVFETEMDKKLQDFYDALNWGLIPTKTNEADNDFF